MKSRSITIGIFLSAALVMTAAGLYWMASRAQAGNHQLSISLIRRIQQLESQWSIETARVRSDPLADFDALVTFIPRMERLKADLSDAMLSTPNLPERLASDLGAYLSAIDAKEERIERFKTGYAVLRNSIRYLPLAATSVMQQVEERGGETAFVRNISSVTDEIHTYLATPAPPEKERLMRVLQELGDGIMARHPSLANTIANFVAHGQVLLDKQAPTEEIFQEATSDRITVLGEAIIEGLEAEIVKVEEIVSNYERGILASGGALWLLWLAIALRLPKESRQRDDSRPTGIKQSPGQQEDRAAMDKIAAAATPSRARPSREEDEMEWLTANLVKSEEQHGHQGNAARATEPTAYRVGLEVVSEQLTALAERINSSTDILNDIQVKLFSDGPESVSDSDNTPDEMPDEMPDKELPFRAADDGLTTDEEGWTLGDDEELKTAAAVVASIRAQANGLVEFAERLPSLSRKRDDAQALVSINDSIDEVVDHTQARTKALLVKELSPVPDVFASETEISLILANIIDNSVWAVEERGQKRGVIRIETAQAEDNGVVVTITDNGIGISSEKRKKVFNPFYTSRDNAAGMGLTSAQYLVEKYGGSLLMNSLPNQGTMVRIALPTGTAVD